ncbi:MAG: YaiO family outer membrane beta-barrel protein [Paludibacter sp.]|nr:YaiO family outer membrane beta-barrel protein [Paludibacter sp.]
MRKPFIVFFFLFLLFGSGLSAQINTDSIFSKAIYSSRNKQYVQAVESAKKALQTDPHRGDILVFIANVYSWQEKNDSALIYIHKAQEINYHQADFYESWTNILLRSHQYKALLQSCTEAEKQNYSSKGIFKKRLIAYSELKLYTDGISFAELPKNRIYMTDEPINSLYSNLLIKRNTHIVYANYKLDFFDNGLPQHLGSLGYSFRVGKQTLGFRANYANRFNKNDVQLETDFYLQLNHDQYMYFNYGYAFDNLLFPHHRVGFEYYVPLKYISEVSIGGRYMNYPTSQVLILTGHLEKYIGKSWVALRPFYVYTTENKTKSLSLIGSYRLFGKNEMTYWGLELGFGNSPDDRYAITQNGSFNQLTAYNLKIEKNFMLSRISDVHIGLGYTREEFVTNQFRNRYTVELGYKLRLK